MVPSCTLSVRFCMAVDTVTSSPCLTNRGRLGDTISGLLDMVCASYRPVKRSLVYASA